MARPFFSLRYVIQQTLFEVSGILPFGCRGQPSELEREIVEQSSTNSEAKVLRTTPVVLIVEDEFSVRWGAAEYLREAAYSVIEASNAADAITVLTSGARIDLAFIDFKLPGGLNGLMLAKWLDAYRPAIPVLRADAAALPFAAQSADLVVACMSLLDFDDFGGAVAEIGRVLRPKGQLCLAQSRRDAAISYVTAWRSMY